MFLTLIGQFISCAPQAAQSPNATEDTTVEQDVEPCSCDNGMAWISQKVVCSEGLATWVAPSTPVVMFQAWKHDEDYAAFAVAGPDNGSRIAYGEVVEYSCQEGDYYWISYVLAE